MLAKTKGAQNVPTLVMCPCVCVFPYLVVTVYATHFRLGLRSNARFQTAEEQCIYIFLFSCAIFVRSGVNYSLDSLSMFISLNVISPSSFAPSSLTPLLLMLMLPLLLLLNFTISARVQRHTQHDFIQTGPFTRLGVGNPEKYPHACATYLLHLLFWSQFPRILAQC